MKLFKLLIVSAIATMVAMSCGVDTDGVQRPNGATHRITASTETHSRTSLDGSYNVVWSEGDHLVVTAATADQQNGSATLYSLVEGAGTTTGVFEGGFNTAFDIYSAFYPYDYYAGFNYSGIILFLLPVENAIFIERNIANNANPMYGVGSTDKGLQLQNLCGILELPIKGEGTLSAITLESDKSVAGYFAVLNGETDLYRVENYPQSNIVSGYIEPAIALSSTPRSVYILLPPNIYNSLTITTIDSNGKSTTLTSSNPITIERSGITVVSAFSHKPNGGNSDSDLENPQEKPEIGWN